MAATTKRPRAKTSRTRSRSTARRQHPSAFRKQIAAEAQRLRDQKVPVKEIAARLGVTPKKVYALTRGPQRKPGENDLSHEAVRAFLRKRVTEGEDEAKRLAGQALTETQTRLLFRYQHEDDSAVTIWALDKLLAGVGVHLDEFFRFVEDLGVSPWARGVEPAWMTADLTHEDAHWCDPDEPAADGHADIAA